MAFSAATLMILSALLCGLTICMRDWRIYLRLTSKNDNLNMLKIPSLFIQAQPAIIDTSVVQTLEIRGSNAAPR